MVPGGSCPTVGIAGLTLGGGVGVVARAYGLTCDNVQSLQIVTADGQVRTASASTNSDLFWACRGGGGGNFGVVTSFTLPHPSGRGHRRCSSCPGRGRRRPGSSRRWQSWAPQRPDELWSNLHLAAAPGGSVPSIQVGGTYLGPVSEAHAQLETLSAAVGRRSAPFVQTPTYLHAMLVEAGCAGLTAAECHLPSQDAAAGSPARVNAKSEYFTGPLAARGFATLLAGVVKFQHAGARRRRRAGSRSTRSAARSTASRPTRPPSCTATRSSERSTRPPGRPGRPRPR